MTDEQLKDANEVLNRMGIENVQDIIIIKNGATVGDVIESIFQKMNVANDQEWFVHLQDGKGNIIKISKALWNAPYKTESKE